ncbi:MAG: hypothetical protein ACREFQ_06690 [Stellaceae bacterium]
MWIALGVIGVLWFAGMVIWPDKNAPPISANPPTHVAAATAPAKAPTRP